MEKSCNQCDTNLETTACNCEPSQAATATPEQQTAPVAPAITAQSVKDTATNSVKEAAAIMNIDQEKAEQLMNSAKATTKNIFSLYTKVLKDNNAAINAPTSDVENKNRLTLGITQFVIILLITMLSLSSLRDYVSFGSRLMTAIFTALTSSTLILAPAGVAFLAARKNNPNATFIDILGVFCVATVLPCTLYIGVIILTKLNFMLGLLFAFTVGTALFVHYYEAILTTTLRNKNQALNILYFAYAATAIAFLVMTALSTAIVGQHLSNQFMYAIEDIMSGIMYGLY